MLAPATCSAAGVSWFCRLAICFGCFKSGIHSAATLILNPASLIFNFATIILNSTLLIPNIYESRTLAELRDTLLPKLLSGELRVPAAEKLVEVNA